VIGATVPKTAVHADGQFRAGEQDVDSASRQSGNGGVDSITEAMRVQQPAQAELRSSFAAGQCCEAGTSGSDGWDSRRFRHGSRCVEWVITREVMPRGGRWPKRTVGRGKTS
jgi:hypothetical protein